MRRPSTLLVFDGQSQVNSPPFGITNYLRTYPHIISSEMVSDRQFAMHLAARSGTTYAERAVNQVERTFDPMKQYDRKAVVICAGQQEILNGLTAAAIYTLEETYADLCRAAGADWVINCTSLPGTVYTAPQNVVRLALRTLQNANANAKFDACVDLAFDQLAGYPTGLQVPPPGSSTYYWDGVHVNEPATDIIAPLIYDVLVALGIV